MIVFNTAAIRRNINVHIVKHIKYYGKCRWLQGHILGAVFVQHGLQSGDQLLRVDALLAAQRVHLLVQVGHLHAGLGEVAQLLRQVRQQVLQVGGGARLAVAPHRHHLAELVVQGGVDGADGVFTAEEGLASWTERAGRRVGFTDASVQKPPCVTAPSAVSKRVLISYGLHPLSTLLGTHVHCDSPPVVTLTLPIFCPRNVMWWYAFSAAAR